MHPGASRALVLAVAASPAQDAPPERIARHNMIPEARASRAVARIVPVRMGDLRGLHRLPHGAVSEFRRKSRHVPAGFIIFNVKFIILNA